MEEYRVYVIGQDVISRIELQCSDEGKANGSQKRCCHVVEFWQADRFMERLEPEH